MDVKDFKIAMKQICSDRGLTATFMAKWNENLPGSSGHLYQSLVRADSGENAFYDESAPHRLLSTAFHYLGGLVANSNSPAEFAAFIRREYDKWAQVVKTTGIRVD